MTDKLTQAIATCPNCRQHVEFKFADKTRSAQMSDKLTDEELAEIQKRHNLFDPNVSDDKVRWAALGDRTKLLDHIAALTVDLSAARDLAAAWANETQNGLKEITALNGENERLRGALMQLKAMADNQLDDDGMSDEPKVLDALDVNAIIAHILGEQS